MNNEVNLNLANNQPQQRQSEEDKKSLDDLDLSKLIIIKNPNSEVAIGK
jgi:hypothetical protein